MIELQKIGKNSFKIILKNTEIKLLNKGEEKMFNLFSNGNIKKIGQDEAKRRLDSDEKITLVDVREPGEYAQGHIPGSISLPLSQFDRFESVLKDKEATIFVYCLSGARSSRAADFLSKQGYNNLINIGGISSWPYEIETNRQQVVI